MSEKDLRDAAKVLRKQAEKATPGPWHSKGPVLQTRSIYAEPGRLRGQGRDLAVAERVFSRDAAYVVTMHPGVGLALADLLDMLAGDREQADVDGGTWDHGVMPLVRALLGKS